MDGEALIYCCIIAFFDVSLPEKRINNYHHYNEISYHCSYIIHGGFNRPC